ncbi:hypothetical protein [Yoonia sp.]|uniref:hypothetical protein n=1 Tax=Yoonia sp. TaxID=2212373 RepID=UPI0025ED3354|nr:hypothetical protein [Yoonia sp.]
MAHKHRRAFVTAMICGVPTWFTVQAVRADNAPLWAYGAAAGLGGVAPSRKRRR